MKRFLSSLIKLFFPNSKKTPDVPVALDDGFYEIANADALLATSELNANLHQQIVSLTSLPDEYFQLYYKPVIDKYAEYVQALPASRGHHHANSGGLLTHTLEVVKFGLQFKEKYVLPPNTPSENLSQAQQRWFYGVFLTCLLHDIGKPMSDMLCHIYDMGGKSLGRWSPIFGPMTDLPEAHSYTLKFAPKSNYSHHKELTLLLTTKLVPPNILDWLQRDTELFQTILLTLRGDPQHSSVLSEIVKRADGESTKRNIGASGLQRIDDSFVSLHDKILNTIRNLVRDGQALTYNRPGANVFVYKGALYVVSKVFVDLLRTTMERDGHTGIPSQNTRVFDIMQDHLIIEPNHEGNAVWSGMINIKEWEQEMSLLKIPLSSLALSQEEMPDQLDGKILFVESSKKRGKEPTSNQSPESAQEISEVGKGKEKLTEAEANKDAHKPLKKQTHQNGSAVITEQPQVNDNNSASSKSLAIQRGEAFIHWIRSGISNKTLHYNDTRASIHVVSSAKLIFLLSPKIFKMFMEQADDTLLQKLDLKRDQFSRLQAGFAKLQLHKLHPTTNNLLHTVLVKKSDKLNRMNGIIIEDWSLFFSAEPPLNNKITIQDGD